MNNAKKLSMQAIEKTKGGKFIGYAERCGETLYDFSNNECYQNCTINYYFFFIRIDQGNPTPKSVPCP